MIEAALVYLAWLAAWSVVAFLAMGWDKRRAARGGWRVAEKTLHTLELIGGWPGALLGRRVFRHKTVKARYRLVAGLMVLLHVTLVAGLTALWVWAMK